MADQSDDMLAYLRAIDSNMAIIKRLVTEVVTYMKDAESEIPEKMRRFIMYMHDVHDIINMYTELGQPVPPHVHREAERCDDRYRQLLKELHLDGGAFEKVRREMAKQEDNRWDHTRQLFPPKPGATPNASRQSDIQQNGVDKDRTPSEGG